MMFSHPNSAGSPRLRKYAFGVIPVRRLNILKKKDEELYPTAPGISLMAMVSPLKRCFAADILCLWRIVVKLSPVSFFRRLRR